jgi:hypothetical protein
LHADHGRIAGEPLSAKPVLAAFAPDERALAVLTHSGDLLRLDLGERPAVE